MCSKIHMKNAIPKLVRCSFVNGSKHPCHKLIIPPITDFIRIRAFAIGRVNSATIDIDKSPCYRPLCMDWSSWWGYMAISDLKKYVFFGKSTRYHSSLTCRWILTFSTISKDVSSYLKLIFKKLSLTLFPLKKHEFYQYLVCSNRLFLYDKFKFVTYFFNPCCTSDILSPDA